MLYLPEKAYNLGGGRSFLFFFHTTEQKAVSLEIYPDSEDPPQICYYDNSFEWTIVEKAIHKTGAFETYADDFRIEWAKDNSIRVIGRVTTANGPLS